MVATGEMTKGRAQEGGHWYNRAGEAVYEIRGANGNMRNVDLRDARKHQLVPGYSGVARMEAAPGLERWKIKQAMLSCMTLPRKAGEDDDQFMARALEDSWEQAEKAREKGKAIHAAIQGFYEGKPTMAEWWPYIAPVEAELNLRFGAHARWEAERSFAHRFGYGGKSDLLCREPRAVVDIKSTEFDKDVQLKDLCWPEHVGQLASYARGHFGTMLMPEGVQCLNVYVSSNNPGLVRVRQWEPDELATALEAFDHLLALWKIRKRYNGGW